jgi:hypothetical protein
MEREGRGKTPTDRPGRFDLSAGVDRKAGYKGSGLLEREAVDATPGAAERGRPEGTVRASPLGPERGIHHHGVEPLPEAGDLGLPELEPRAGGFRVAKRQFDGSGIDIDAGHL